LFSNYFKKWEWKKKVFGDGFEGEGRTYYEYKYVFWGRWNWENDKKYILYLEG
jgi:hypothetical protein